MVEKFRLLIIILVLFPFFVVFDGKKCRGTVLACQGYIELAFRIMRILARFSLIPSIETAHVSEAIQPVLSGVEGYRNLDRQFWI
jgi:hypothetical protein